MLAYNFGLGVAIGFGEGGVNENKMSICIGNGDAVVGGHDGLRQHVCLSFKLFFLGNVPL